VIRAESVFIVKAFAATLLVAGRKPPRSVFQVDFIVILSVGSGDYQTICRVGIVLESCLPSCVIDRPRMLM